MIIDDDDDDHDDDHNDDEATGSNLPQAGFAKFHQLSAVCDSCFLCFIFTGFQGSDDINMSTSGFLRL